MAYLISVQNLKDKFAGNGEWEDWENLTWQFIWADDYQLTKAAHKHAPEHLREIVAKNPDGKGGYAKISGAIRDDSNLVKILLEAYTPRCAYIEPLQKRYQHEDKMHDITANAPNVALIHDLLGNTYIATLGDAASLCGIEEEIAYVQMMIDQDMPRSRIVEICSGYHVNHCSSLLDREAYNWLIQEIKNQGIWKW